MNKMKKLAQKNKLLMISIPIILIIGGIFVVNFFGSQFLFDLDDAGLYEGSGIPSPPTIYIYAPSDGYTVEPTASVTYNVKVVDVDGDATRLKVMFNDQVLYDGSNLVKYGSFVVPSVDGKYAFFIRAWDATGLTMSKTHYITVGSNDPPTISGSVSPTTISGFTGRAVQVAATFSASDPDGNLKSVSTTITRTSLPVLSSLTGTAPSAYLSSGGSSASDSGLITFTNDGDTGTETWRFTFKALDRDNVYATSIKILTITWVQAPDPDGDSDGGDDIEDLFAPGFELPILIIALAVMWKIRRNKDNE